MSTITSTSFTEPKVGFVIGISGGGVKVSPSSGMTVSISSGFFFLGGKQVFYGGGTKTISTAHATLGRYDVMGIDSSGTIFVKEGTPASSPSVPVVRDDLLLLAVITVTANDSTIAAGDITDVRNIGGVSADGTTISVSTSGVASVLTSGLTSTFDPIVASGQGSISIVGNGTAQTVFTDTFTQDDGDIIEIICRYRMDNTAGADAPDFILKLGSTNLNTSTLTSGGGDAFRMVRAIYSYSATAGQGWGFVEQIGNSGATGTAAQTIAKNDVDTWANAGGSLSLTADPAAATTTRVRYAYMVKRHVPGV